VINMHRLAAIHMIFVLPLAFSIASCARTDPQGLPTMLSPMFGLCLDASAPENVFDLDQRKPVDWDDGVLTLDGRKYYVYVGLHPNTPLQPLPGSFNVESLPESGFRLIGGGNDDPRGVLFAGRLPPRLQELRTALFVYVKPNDLTAPAANGTPGPAILESHLIRCARTEWD
jgi:hypothetical protein